MSAVRDIEYFYKNANHVELDFYKAFGNGDFFLMEALIADDGVCYTHAGEGTVIGRQNVIDHWNLILDGIPQITIKRELLNVTQGDDVEIHLILESHICNEAESEMSFTYTTNTYIRQGNGWRLQMQHASQPFKRSLD